MVFSVKVSLAEKHMIYTLNKVVIFPHINEMSLSNVVINHVLWQKIFAT